MDHFPSPPTSPVQQSYHEDDVDKAICGSCDKTLSSDWFCINCHKRCSTCNRFLSVDDHCSRCWTFDSQRNIFIRKQPPAIAAAGGIHANHINPVSSPPSPPHQQRYHILFFVTPNSTSTGEKKMLEKKS